MICIVEKMPSIGFQWYPSNNISTTSNFDEFSMRKSSTAHCQASQLWLAGTPSSGANSHFVAGWWLSHPSEKYESQLG